MDVLLTLVGAAAISFRSHLRTVSFHALFFSSFLFSLSAHIFFLSPAFLCIDTPNFLIVVFLCPLSLCPSSSSHCTVCVCVGRGEFWFPSLVINDGSVATALLLLGLPPIAGAWPDCLDAVRRKQAVHACPPPHTHNHTHTPLSPPLSVSHPHVRVNTLTESSHAKQTQAPTRTDRRPRKHTQV